jgi:hypothetical protein
MHARREHRKDIAGHPEEFLFHGGTVFRSIPGRRTEFLFLNLYLWVCKAEPSLLAQESHRNRHELRAVGSLAFDAS